MLRIKDLIFVGIISWFLFAFVTILVVVVPLTEMRQEQFLDGLISDGIMIWQRQIHEELRSTDKWLFQTHILIRIINHAFGQRLVEVIVIAVIYGLSPAIQSTISNNRRHSI